MDCLTGLRGGEEAEMNKPDSIRLNMRWISETEVKINALEAEIAALEIGISKYKQNILRIEGEE